MTDLLFVGPRQDSLTNHQRSLRAREPDWAVLHSMDADSALQQVSRRPADIVLACFPRLEDYETLFSRVAAANPSAIRLALFDSPPLKVKGAHQSLPNAGESDDLHSVLTAAARVAARSAGHDGLKEIVSRFQDVPSPPQLYFDIREQLESESGTAASMAKIAGRDPALVARTLRIANSGYYARPRSIGDVADAIRLLGSEVFMGIVLAAHLFSGLPPPGARLDQLWQHAMEVSALARQISRIEGANRDQASHSYIAGLLHDIGMIVLLQNESARYQPMWHKSCGDESALISMERETFGITHGELGAMILMLWNLPGTVVDAVANSHASHDEAGAGSRALTLTDRAVLAAEWILMQKDHAAPVVEQLPAELADTSAQSLERWTAARDSILAGTG